jgi:hypothetical protein
MYQYTKKGGMVRLYCGFPPGYLPMATAKTPPKPPIERVQTGVRLEKRLLKVLKGLAESLDLSLGDLLEGIALHALDNKPPFSAATLKKVADLKRVYGLDLTAADSHRLRE